MNLRFLNGRLAFLIADIDGFGKVFSFEEFVKADADPRHAFFWPIWGEVDCVITPLPMGKRTHCNHP